MYVCVYIYVCVFILYFFSKDNVIVDYIIFIFKIILYLDIWKIMWH